MRPLWAILAAALGIVGGGTAAVYDLPMPVEPRDCAAPPALAGLGPDLGRVAARVKEGGPLTIVALGSSSTRGVGASAPSLSYPSRLEADLGELLPSVAVRVVNRGKNGEEVPQMLARLDRDVLEAHPDLVIWQLGTNAVLHGANADSEAPLIARGIARLKQRDIDVVLMDLQYAPRVLGRSGYAAMERVIGEAAKRARVGLFRRFAIMQAWQAARPAAGPQTVSADGLHMNDRGYGCVAADLADALAANALARLRPTQSRDAGTIAGLDGGEGRVPPVWSGGE